ncbi:MAG TPA: adenylate kinase [Thermoanaerobaculia bacterium]
MADFTSRNGGRPRRLVLIGPPGSGKGTQAQILADQLGVPAISTGEMLRAAVAAGSDLGKRVRRQMSGGGLVDDPTMAELVRERLARPDAAEGFLLDGYPRTEGQAATLEEILAGRGQSLDGALLIEVPEEELEQRMAGRGREDDDQGVARARLEVYRETNPRLVGYYQRQGLLREVDGHQPIERVTLDILAALGEAR